MPDVYLGRFNRFVEKLLNIKGGPTVVDLNPSVSVSIPLMESGVETRSVQGWNRFAASATSPAVAAQNAAIRLRNPPTSGALIVIEQIIAVQTAVSTASLLALQIENGLPDLAGGSVVPLRLDFRQTGGSVGHVSFGGSTVSGPLINYRVSGTTATFIYTLDQEFAILPGDGYEVFDGTQNEAINASFVWRERALESSELT